MKNLRLNFETLSFQNLGELNKALEILDENGIDYQAVPPSFAYYEDLISWELGDIQEELDKKDIGLDVELQPEILADLISGFAFDEYTNGQINDMIMDTIRNVLKKELPEVHHALMNKQG